MGLLSNLFGARPEADSSTRDPSDNFWYSGIERAPAAGVPVSVENAISVPVVYDCLKVLSESVSTLPFAIFSRDSDGNKERADNHPVSILLENPNDECTSVEFFGQMVWDLASRGNSYNLVTLEASGQFRSVERLDNRYTYPERLTDGSIRYRYREPGSPERIYFNDRVWHLKTFPLSADGITGQSAIEAGREVISTALALQQFASSFFKNDATPPWVVKNPNHFKDDTSKGNFLNAIKKWWGGSRRHGPAVLEYGMDIVKLGNSNEESQFLETRKENAVDITRLWRMPPHKVGIMDKATFSNIEQQSLEYVIDTLLPWLRLIEKSIRKHLIIRSDLYFFEFNVAGHLRGDLKARYEAYAIGRNWGWLSVNEIRKLENLNGIGTDGDVYLQPLNMQEAGAPPLHTTAKAKQLNGHAAEHPAIN